MSRFDDLVAERLRHYRSLGDATVKVPHPAYGAEGALLAELKRRILLLFATGAAVACGVLVLVGAERTWVICAAVVAVFNTALAVALNAGRHPYLPVPAAVAAAVEDAGEGSGAHRMVPVLSDPVASGDAVRDATLRVLEEGARAYAAGHTDR